MSILGFTGTRFGMNPAQLATVRKLCEGWEHIFELHHGDCVGADGQMHDLVRKFFPTARIHIWPGTDDQHRAFKKGDVEHTRSTHFARNREIVRACDILIATPRDVEDPGRGGTWYTINHAAKVERHTVLVRPDGIPIWS